MGDDRWPKIHAERTVRAKETSDVVDERIHSAFRNVKSFPLKRIIIQFWRPVKTSGGVGVLSCYGNPYALSPVNHRLRKYRSFCSKYYYSIDKAHGPMTIRGSPPASAFLNHFPELVLDLRVHRGTPLVDLALQSSGLKHAKNETGKALQAAVLSHAITLGQVWFPFDNYKSPKGRKLLAKFDTYCVISPGDSLPSVKIFYDYLHYLPLNLGEGLVGRTLGTSQQHLCRNIYRWSENTGVLAVLSANTKCTCFVICLRCNHTGNLDYAFEFFWPLSRNHLAMMEALLLTIREHLPSFKILIHCTFAKIFPGNQPSETRALVGMKRKSIEGQSELTNISNPEGEDEDDDDDDLIILAAYKVDYRLFFLPSSPTFRNFMEKINQEFELGCAGTYNIEYQVLPGEWYSLTDGTSLRSCISSYQASKNIDHIKLRVLVVET
ncbi:hypothetical protein L1987_08840 [Smallanthus sonchifolius]|uniref:Uncharacterized protein n=1 Tax=Smallanthus sonchifolius TaxID=185202 RepID=A0ACB9JNG6_9ASTR|nr:hypothetical protein L1987_08840 [Smallanthus sonchifolius]